MLGCVYRVAYSGDRVKGCKVLLAGWQRSVQRVRKFGCIYSAATGRKGDSCYERVREGNGRVLAIIVRECVGR